MVEVQIATLADELPDPAQLAAVGDRVLAHEGREDYDACLRVVDAEEIRALNEQYRGFNKPTNVLSFPADVELAEVKLLGDVVLCAPVVVAEAREQGKTVADHSTHMVVHGLLHLCGYDHEEDAEARQMEALEVQVLAGLGVEDPYR